ncbi:MAG: M50 family metallopeptidase [Bryobacterales bacterium]|nr:M50 family metallopeptidase [Bryobacterales bacterium]
MSIAFVVAAAFLALVVHEVGHALGGNLRGMRLGMLIVGPIQIQREVDGHLSWRLNKILSLAGGVVSSFPESTEGLRRAMLSFAAGGPVTSIVVGLLVLAIYRLAGLGDSSVPHGIVHDALAEGVFMLGVLSVGLGLLTLLPVNQGVFVNDGKRILRLLRPSAAADAYAAVMGLGSYMIAGVRPRDWDPGLVERATSLADGSIEDLNGRYMAYDHSLDRGEVDVAGEHIRYLASHAEDAHASYRPVIHLAVAYFAAAYGDNAASARSRLARAGKSALLALDPTARIRAEGAVLLAEGDANGAFEKFREAYSSLAGAWTWDRESTMAEIRRLSRARGLPDPGADRAE